MDKREKKTCDELTIGSKVYLVNRDYAFKKKFGGVILVGKVKTFRNVKGNVIPEFTETGRGGVVLTMERYVPFVKVQDAIDSIKS